MEAIGKLLENASLTSFSKKFLEEGYDNFEYIVGLEEGRLRKILEEDIGMKKGHIMRFLDSSKEFRLDPINKNPVNNPEKSNLKRKSWLISFVS